MKNIVALKTIIKPVSESSGIEGECWDLIATSYKLKRNGRYDGIVEQIKLYFRKAEKYYFNRICSEMALYLHNYYYKIKQDKVSGEKYEKLYFKYQHLAQIEEQCKIVYSKLTLDLNQTRNPNKRIMGRLGEACRELTPHLSLKNPHISIYIYPLLIANAYNRQAYEEAADLCNEAIAFFESHKISRAHHFYNYLVPSLIQGKEHQRAGRAIQVAMNKVRAGSYSWSVFNYYSIINELYAGRYDEALHQYLSVAGKRQLNQSLQEQLQIVKGYLKFLGLTGHLSQNINFRIGKFVNDMPIFTADKHGNFANILLLRFLINFATNRDRLIDDWQAIERTANRYFKKGTREQIFLRMLIRIPRYQFNRAAVELRCKEDLKLLESKVVDVEREVLPYERIWGVVMGELK